MEEGIPIPIHLLTAECFETYCHLREDGILAVNVTNRYLELAPVVRRLAEERGMQTLHIGNDGDERRRTDGSDWVLVTRNRAFLGAKAIAATPAALPDIGLLWTDDFSSLVGLLK